MNIRSTLQAGLITLAMVFCSMLAVNAQTTPVQKYGQLKIFNGKVSDQNNNPVVLRGMSLFWSGYPEGAPYYNATTVKWLRDDWCVDVVRAAMSVETGSSNYVNNPAAEMAKVKAVIDACIANGIYVIVDFHTHNAESYKTQAKTFFTEIATTYGNVPNVLYEPYNEPIYQSWGTIKQYHNELIQTIRAKDPDNIIICGTRTYSQEVDEAANDPVTGTNIAYTVHYYANSHQGSLRQKVTNALNKGVAIFATEYGTTDASGNGGYNPGESQTWWNFLEANKISSANWSVTNKNETSAALKPGTGISNWTTNDLTASGALVRAYLKGKCNVTVTTGSVTVGFTGNKIVYDAGETVTMTATATVANGTISKVEFYSGTTLLNSDASSPYTFSTSTLASGGHSITAKSYDAAGAVIAISPVYVISIIGASNVATTGITDQFENTDQFSELTGGVNGASCGTATAAAAAGIYWFEDRDAATPFKAEATRTGNGTLQYLISQPQKSYNVIGFNFGEYCQGTTKQKYTLDLTQNAVLQLTVAAPATNTATLDLKFQMKDADGTVIAINKTFLTETVAANWYKYEIGFSKNHLAPDYLSLAPGTTTNFSFDFKNTLSIKNPNNPNFPTDINLNNTDFDFSKVVEVVIIPVNKLDTGTPNYDPLAFTDQKIIFSGLKLGNPALGVDICTTPKAVTTATKSYCQNATNAVALTATGTAGLTLKWYASATGGVANTVAPIPSTSVAGDQTYYVSQAVPGSSTCEGPRTELKVTIVPAATSDAGQDVTITSATSASLTAVGSSAGTWSTYSVPTGATVTFSPSATSAAVTANGLTVNGTYGFVYTVAGTGSCASAKDSVAVTKTVPPCTTPNAVTPADISYCRGSLNALPLTASGLATGNKFQWYTNATGGTASDNAPTPSTTTAGITTYYVSQVSTTNASCESVRSPLKVTIVAPATANAGNTIAISTETSVTLIGTGSAGGTWSLLIKPTGAGTITISPSTGASVTASGLTVDGTYTFTYTVQGTSPCGAVAASVNVNKTSPSCTNPATANAGNNQTISTATTATLTGSGSSAGTWSVQNKPGAANVTFSGTGASVTANGLTADGIYTFVYTVSATSPCVAATSTMTVTKTTPVCTNPTVANAGMDQTISTANTVTLTGTGTTAGTWTVFSKPAGTTVTISPSGTAATVTASGLTATGVYEFTYTVNGVSPCITASDVMKVTKSTTTAINSAYLNDNIELYPNPVTETLFIGMDRVEGSKSLTVVDMLGKIVYATDAVSIANIDMSDLSRGMYFVHIETESGKITKSVIKQ